MTIPTSALPYLKKQRSGFRNNTEWHGALIAETEEIRSHVPGVVESITDIGCGVGIMAAMMYHHFDKPALFLVDGEGEPSDAVFGYTDTLSRYNSRGVIADVLSANQVPLSSYVYFNASQGDQLPPIESDLIVSLLSCGYHYPISWYLDWITRSLADDGALVIDVRDGTDGMDVLYAVFDDVQVIHQRDKKARVIARR